MEFATLHMDTYKVVQLLQDKGYTKEEAEGFIAAVQEITLSGVATKQDITLLKHDIFELRNELREDIAYLKHEISKVNNDNLKFLIIQSITLVGILVALSQIL